MRIKITELHPDCLWKKRGYENEIVGTVFTTETDIKQANRFPGGWSYCEFEDRGDHIVTIGGFKYIEVPDEPSQMSELAGWIGENMPKEQPKKLSWIQKVRGYDDLHARCNAAESMRDHYKSLMTEALRDRDLHAKVADNWQQKCIEANKKYDGLLQECGKLGDHLLKSLDEIEKAIGEDQTGRRLKFSAGHNHITIIVGNPVTYIQNFNITTEDKFGDTDWNVSVCSPKDIYNWKIGVIKALDNLCENYSKDLRRDLRKAMAKKYPEVFIA